jgi:hypothetical protein
LFGHSGSNREGNCSLNREGNCSLSTLTARPLLSYVQAGKKERKKETARPLLSYVQAGKKERKKERKTFLVDLLGGIYSENKHISPKLL